MNHNVFYLAIRKIYHYLTFLWKIVKRKYLCIRKFFIYRKIAKFSRPYKIHIGCGNIKLPQWINVDMDRSLGTADIIWDAQDGLPFPDESCAFIYCEHMLEHLTVLQGQTFLRECKRVLEPNGIVRVAMPSLDILIEKSADGTWADQDWLKWPGHEFIQSRAEMINIAFRWWGHQWLYDRVELHRRAREAGFETVNDVQWGQSEFEELSGLETRKDSLLICEMRA